MTQLACLLAAAAPASTDERSTLETTFGYLSIIESAEHGYFGGYLIISALGRPLEFHCTAPVRPSRAQRILYGPTLEPFLLGEQIAGTLLQAANLTPNLILVNCDAALHIRSRTKAPLVHLRPNDTQVATESAHSSGTAAAASASICAHGGENDGVDHSVTREFSSNAFQLPVGYESDRDQVIGLLSDLARSVSLAEPFGRIEEAIREAQRLGSSEHHDQAA